MPQNSTIRAPQLQTLKASTLTSFNSWCHLNLHRGKRFFSHRITIFDKLQKCVVIGALKTVQNNGYQSGTIELASIQICVVQHKSRISDMGDRPKTNRYAKNQIHVH